VTLLLLIAAIVWIGIATVFVTMCISAGRTDRALLTGHTGTRRRTQVVRARGALPS
jgi:hypothetical protein